MNTATILNQLKTQLAADATLASYVKKFFLGVREDITNFPAIVIEPLLNQEGDEIYTRQEMNFRVYVIAFIKVEDPDKHLVGDANVKGILDVENDIKKAISSDRTLGGTCYHTRILQTLFEFVDFPLRSVKMEVEMYFRQNTTTRI